MREKKFYSKLIGSCMLVLCMAFSMVLFAKANSTNEINKVSIESYSEDSLETLIQDQRAEGYLYAGLFNADSAELSKEDAVKTPQVGEAYIAKFVPAGVLSVKGQISANLLQDETLTSSSIRFVTTIDSLAYKEVGFSVTRIKEDGTKVELVDPETITQYVYQTLYAVDATDTSGGTMSYTPQDIHSCSKFFKTYTIKEVPADYYNADLTVTPYWVTLDGVKVEGLKSIKTINLGRSWIYVNAMANTDTEQYGTYNHPYTELATALDNLVVDKKGKILLQSNVAIDSAVTIEDSSDITVQSESETTYTVAGSDAANNLFEVNGKLAINNLNLEGGKSGIYMNEGSEVVATNVNIKRLSATDVALVVVNKGSTFTLNEANGTSSIDGAELAGRGVDVHGTFVLNGGTVKNNNATDGGGVYVYNDGTFTMENGTIQNNTVTSSEYSHGGGVYVAGKFTMDGGSIQENTATTSGKNYTFGAGVYVTGEFVMNGGSISNHGDKNNRSISKGAGVCVNDGGTFTMNAGSIEHNYASQAGAGVAVEAVDANDSLFIMKGGNIANNNSSGAAGAIVVRANTSFTMEGGTINNNTASTNGGAVYMLGTVTINAGEISSNHSNAEGGGIYMVKGTTITIKDGKIKNNTTTNKNGAGIYAAEGNTIKLTGNGEISGNNAGTATVQGVFVQNAKGTSKVTLYTTFTMGNEIRYNSLSNRGTDNPALIIIGSSLDYTLNLGFHSTGTVYIQCDSTEAAAQILSKISQYKTDWTLSIYDADSSYIKATK